MTTCLLLAAPSQRVGRPRPEIGGELAADAAVRTGDDNDFPRDVIGYGFLLVLRAAMSTLSGDPDCWVLDTHAA